MTRYSYAGGAADFVFDVAPSGFLRLRPASLMVFTEENAGVRVTDLRVDGTPVTEVPVANTGLVPAFEGPDEYVDDLWVATGPDKPRIRLTSNAGEQRADAAADRAEEALAQARQITGIDDVEGAVEAMDANPASPIRQQQDARLAATFVAGRSVPDIAPASAGNKLSKAGVILAPGPPGAFDETAVESLFVFFDHEAGKWGGVYTGYQGSGGAEVARIGLAHSDDLRVWDKDGTLYTGSGIAGQPDKSGVTGPVLIYENGLWHLFHIGLADPGYEGGTYHPLMLSTSPSLSSPTWTRRGPILTAAGPTAPVNTRWREQNVWHPSFVKHEGRWYCFVNTSKVDFSEVIGYAVGGSTLLDPFTFDDVNSPLLVPAGGVEGTIVGDPVVRAVPGGYRMDYYGVGAGTAVNLYATTSYDDFPLGWVRGNSGDPILEPSETYDALYAHKGLPTVVGGRVFMPYTAVSVSDERSVALAVDPPFAGDRARVHLASGPYAEYPASTSGYATLGGFEKTIRATPGEWVEIYFSAFANNGAGDLRVDCQIKVAGSVVDYASGNGAAGKGFSNLGAAGGYYTTLGGVATFEVEPGHLSNGELTLALALRADGASRVLYYGTGDSITWAIRNLG